MKLTCSNVFYTSAYLAVIAMSSSVAANQEKLMKNEYERVLNSLMGGEMVFVCGGDDEVFKISSSVFSQPKLFWKNGIEWIELEYTTFKDVGVVFRGLGLTGRAGLYFLRTIRIWMPHQKTFPFGNHHSSMNI